MKYLLICFQVLLILCANSFAGIDSVDINSSVITIRGSGFGTKTTAAPISWVGDELDAGTPGANADLTNYAQVDVSNFTTKYSNAQSHTGNSLFFGYLYDNGMSQYMLDTGGEQEKIYLTMWVRIDLTGSCEDFQWKPWRLRSDTDYDAANGTTILNDWWWRISLDEWRNSNNLGARYNDGVSGGSLDATPDQMLWDVWQRIEAYYVNSTASTANGVTWLRRVGRSGDMLASTSLITRDSDDLLWRYIRFGQYYGNKTGCADTNGGLSVYYDDIYVDNTQARVEISDSSTWSNSTHREVQIPITWESDGTEVTATLNQGTFDDGDTVYFYVIDPDGTISDASDPITIGATTPTSTASGNYSIQ